MSATNPPRSPIACGAIGEYDADALAAIARHLPAPLERVHHDRGSALYLDRAPTPWGHRFGTRGLVWNDTGSEVSGRPRSWREASRAGCCGLLLEGRGRRFVHSGVSGVAPIYVTKRSGVLYFASRADALVRGLGGLFSIDWRAWASIFSTGYPVGRRSAFAQVKRLRPEQAAGAGGRPKPTGESGWSWTGVSAELSVEEGLEGAVGAIQDSVAQFADRDVVSLLSGGLDSRLLLCALRSVGAKPHVVTLGSDDGGRRDEQRYAGSVVRALGIDREVLDPRPEDYLRHWEDRIRASDFERPFFPFLNTAGERLSELGLPVIDGLALDTFAVRGGRYFLNRMIANPDTPRTRRNLYGEAVKNPRKGVQRTIRGGLRGGLIKTGRRQFLAELRRYRRNDHSYVLGFYTTRTMRGVSVGPHRGLGTYARVVTPATDDRVVRSLLSMDPRKKRGFRLYTALMGALDPTVAAISSTADLGVPMVPGYRPVARNDPRFLARLSELALDGPLRDQIRPRVARSLGDPEAFREQLLNYRTFLGVFNICTFHLWCREYGSMLGSIDLDEARDQLEAPQP